MRASRGLRRLVWICLLPLPLCILAAGCGREGTVSGKIYYKGEPVTGGTVHFHPQGKTGNFASVIGTDGSYSIAKLPPGTTKITVMAATKGVPPGIGVRGGGPMAAGRAAKGMEAMGKIGKSASSGAETKAEPAKENVSIPQKYMDPETTDLTFNVTGGSQKHDIKIE